MILGIGVDLIETERITKALDEWGGRFERRVFTEGELATCADRVDRAQALAARFAAKEAALKALGTGVSKGLALRQVEVIRKPGEAPQLELHGAAAERAKSLGVTRMHVSLTHQRSAAIAMVVLESD